MEAVNVEVVVREGGQETQVVMLGGTQGSTHHAVVPPHCAGSSSAASPPCGHAGEREKREIEGMRSFLQVEEYGLENKDPHGHFFVCRQSW